MKLTTDISIVGCGPVGATLANLLADYGYSVAILEKETEIYRAPRAVHLDDEVVRIFQAVGILDDLQKNITPFNKMQFVSGKGNVLLEVGAPDNYAPYGYAPSYWFFQPTLEKILRVAFQSKKQVHWLEGYEVVEVHDHSTYSSLKAIHTSTQKEITITSQYIIGCDGGKSMVRKSMNVDFDNLNFDQQWMVIDTFLKSEEDAALLPQLLQQICNPDRPTTYVPGVGKHRRFEFMLVNGDTKESISQPATIRRLIAQFITPDKLSITRSAVYTFHGLTVTQWRKGRLLLAGDSAHQMPPFAGQGMCSGIRDAHNLAFKLDLVLSGKSTERMLNTYQTERKPHVTELSKGSIKMGKTIQTQNYFLAGLRNFSFFLARRIPLLQEKIKQDFMKKMPYQKGFLGIHSNLSGQLCIQPVIQVNNQEMLLDDLLGNRFALISRASISQIQTKEFTQIVNGQVLQLGMDFHSVVFEEWLLQYKIDFAIIRPDRYIFDAGKMAVLDTVLNDLNNNVLN